MTEVYAGNETDFGEGDRRILSNGISEIGVFRSKGEFYAYENRCPHEGGPACRGLLIPRVEEVISEDRTSHGMRFSDERMHVVCPWHGYEYDLETGVNPVQPQLRLKKYEVVVRDGEVYVVV